MATTSLAVAGAPAYYVTPTAFQVPAGLPSLECAFVLGGTLAASIVNQAPGKPNATAVGAPTVNAYSLGLNQTNYLQTDTLEWTQGTVVALFKLSPNPASIFSTYRHGVSGWWFVQDVAAPYRPLGRALTAPANNGAALPNTLTVGTYEVVATILDTTKGTQTTVHPRTGARFTRAIGTRTPSADKFRIGSSVVPGFFDDVNNGAVEVCAVIAGSAPWTIGQCNQVRQAMRQYYRYRGIAA